MRGERERERDWALQKSALLENLVLLSVLLAVAMSVAATDGLSSVLAVSVQLLLLLLSLPILHPSSRRCVRSGSRRRFFIFDCIQLNE